MTLRWLSIRYWTVLPHWAEVVLYAFDEGALDSNTVKTHRAGQGAGRYIGRWAARRCRRDWIDGVLQE